MKETRRKAEIKPNPGPVSEYGRERSKRDKSLSLSLFLSFSLCSDSTDQAGPLFLCAQRGRERERREEKTAAEEGDCPSAIGQTHPHLYGSICSRQVGSPFSDFHANAATHLYSVLNYSPHKSYVLFHTLSSSLLLRPLLLPHQQLHFAFRLSLSLSHLLVLLFLFPINDPCLPVWLPRKCITPTAKECLLFNVIFIFLDQNKAKSICIY